MTIYFSAEKNGFIDSRLSAIPADAVEISDELHHKLIKEQSEGKVIVVDGEGIPTTIDPQDPSRDEMLKRCKTRANALLVATDWVMLSDVNLANKQAFMEYRKKIRQFRTNPVVDPQWPKCPSPSWSKE